MSIVAIEVVTALDRQMIVTAVRETVSALDGWIEDFRLFSNISAMIRVQLPCANAAEFGRRLAEIGLNPPGDVTATLARLSEQTIQNQEFTCMLNVTFVHTDGDLRVIVPAVPG